MSTTIREFLEMLDGAGLVITDWDLINETLTEYGCDIDCEMDTEIL